MMTTCTHFWLIISIIITNIHLISSSAIIGNSEIILGVDDFGQLLVPYVGDVLGLPTTDPLGINVVGLRNGDGTFSAIERGTYGGGWGVYLSNPASSVTVWASNTFGGPEGELVSFTGSNGDDSAISVVRDTIADPSIEVIHNFHLSSSIYAIQVDVTIRNIGTEDFLQTLYRRIMDWNPDPTPFDEFVTHIGTDASSIQFAHINPFCFPGPDPALLCDPLVPGPNTTDFEDWGPYGQGSTFQFDFGPLAAGEEVEFKIFFGLTPGEDLALQTLNELQFEAASLAQPNITNGPDLGLPYTAFMAFDGVNPTDNPTTYPTTNPSLDPTIDPTVDPTTDPTIDPTADPTIDPTKDPTIDPTADPTANPASSDSYSMSDSESESSSEDAGNAQSNKKKAGDSSFYGDDGDNDNHGHINVITINLSKQIVENLWFLVAAVCIFNGFVFFICRRYYGRK